MGYVGKDARKTELTLIDLSDKEAVCYREMCIFTSYLCRLESSLKLLLEKRENENTLRQLRVDHQLIDFFSNDYLGLARSENLFENIHKKIGQLPHWSGATGSRLLSGNNQYAESLEEKLAAIFNAESSLIFNSGYAANVGVLSSVPQRGDTILYDELSHASIKDGARLSLANRFSFKHNEVGDLEKKIRAASGRVYIVVESIYSMDGDICPLKEIVSVARKYAASIILDEAHSTGILGQNGNGLANALDLYKDIAIRIYTFGKAMGCHGACVAGSRTLRSFLINFARSFIYTTALPYHSLAAIECSFDHLRQEPELQHKLFQKVECFARASSGIVNPSPIQTVATPDVKGLERQLQLEGFNIRAIMSPTVPKGKERLRICLHAYNSEEDIVRLAQVIRKFTA